MNLSELKSKALEIRLEALKAIQKSGSLSVGSSMSVVELLVSLYFGDVGGRPVLHYNVDKPGWDGQDYLVLSSKPATVVLYSILADLGFFEKEELNHFAQINSQLKSTPSNRVPGVSVSVASEGHGLSMACGLAMDLHSERKENRVYCVMDFNEMQSGQVWEAIIYASHMLLSNLVLIVNDCGFQAGGTNKSVMDLGFIQSKFDSFGWYVLRVSDGHDMDEVLVAYQKSFGSLRRPVCIWCHTVSGKGVDFAEGKMGYYNASLSEPELSEITVKLKSLL